MALPKLSAEDRARNLEIAARARVKRAQLRDDIKMGKITFAQLLEQKGDPIVSRLKVNAMLESFPGFGKAKSARLMCDLGISESRRIQGLGKRQIEGLSKVLP